MAERNERYHGRKRGIVEDMKSNAQSASLWRGDKIAGADEPDAAQLTRLIAAYAPHDGSFELRIPGVHVSRASRTNEECVHALRLPCLSIIARGAKTVIVGEKVYEYDPSRMLVYSVTAGRSPSHASQPFRTLPCAEAGPRTAEDCRVGFESVSPRAAPGTGKERGLHHSCRRENCQRGGQINGMSRAAR
jgi:hypothetical protein